jgi:hexokinase
LFSALLKSIAGCFDLLVQVKDTTLATRKVVYDVCDIIAERGARLSAAGIVGILKKINRCGDLMNSCLTAESETNVMKTVVAIDGSLYEKYTKFRNYMEDAMKEMLGEHYADSVTTMLSKDGSGVGAALLAAAISTGLGLGDVGVTK